MRIKIAALAAATVLSLSACGSENIVNENLSESKDEIFVDAVKDNTDAFDTSPDKDILDLAATVCESWESGATMDGFFNVVVESGVNVRDAGWVIGASTAAYCPEFNNKIDPGSTI